MFGIIMDSNKALDFILNCIYTPETPKQDRIKGVFSIEQLNVKLHEYITYENYKNESVDTLFEHHEQEEILDKLVKDGYLKKDLVKGNFTSYIGYHTTFEGRWFIQQGGYQGQLSRQNIEKTRTEILEKKQQLNQSILIMLTFLIAFGTMMTAWYYIIQIWAYYHAIAG